MKLIQPICRSRFAAEDIDFVLSVLRKEGKSDGCLTGLLGDEESRDLILDDPCILRALLEKGVCLRVSTRLYFYVLVRHGLRRVGIEDRRVADYLAEMLSEFARAERTQVTVPGRQQCLEYFFEMAEALSKADDRTAFSLRLHMGNYALFLSGLFPERIQFRAEQRGFPGLSYYRQIGQTQYRVASDHQLARRYEIDDLLCTLSERFETTRGALHDIADRVFSLGENTCEIERLLLSARDAGKLN